MVGGGGGGGGGTGETIALPSDSAWGLRFKIA